MDCRFDEETALINIKINSTVMNTNQVTTDLTTNFTTIHSELADKFKEIKDKFAENNDRRIKLKNFDFNNTNSQNL